MSTPAKGAAQELYKAVFAVLQGDVALKGLLDATGEDPRIYQTSVAFDSAAALKDGYWITYNVSSDLPAPVEQTQDVREIRVDVHVWVRGPHTDKAEQIAKRILELLDGADLATATLFAWQFLGRGYSKTFESEPEVWHIVLGFEGMFMALSA